MKNNPSHKQLFIIAGLLIYFTLLLPICGNNKAFAQEVEWENTIGGSDFDELYSIQQTADGGYICGGTSTSDISGDKIENSLGIEDYWVVKLDAAGSIQWQNTIGGNDQDWLSSIQQTTDGGYICGGQSNSNLSGDKTEISMGLNDFWVVKLDSAGSIQWQNTIGGAGFDVLYSIQQTADGGYICGGTSTSDISGDKTEINIGAKDYWVVKLDAIGNILWQNTIGGSSYDDLSSIQQTIDGGYICGGWSDSDISGDKTENSMAWDYWVVKLDSTGSIQWQNTISGNGWDYLTSIQQTADGGYICGGSSDSYISGDKTENSIGNYDYWVVKLDATGNIQWQNTIGGSFNELLFSIQQTTDGGYMCGGLSGSEISGDKTENRMGYGDYWVVKLDAVGKIQWQNTIGGIDVEELHSIQQTSDGGYICGGFSDSNISGDKNENGIGGWDYWVVKLTSKFNLVTGKLFADANSNMVQDAGELSLAARMVAEQNTGRLGFSNNNGLYYLSVLDTGSFTVAANNVSWYSSAPLNHNVLFTAMLQTDSLNDFAFQPAGIVNDLCVTLTPTGPFRPGFNANYLIGYSNLGTTTINNCSLVFFRDMNVTYVSSNTNPVVVYSDSVVWNLGTLVPFQTGNITVTVNVNAGVPIGTLVNSYVRIDPLAGDANTACNYGEMFIAVTGSYDPNDILVNRSILFTNEIPNPPYLEYTLRFQNTGNDTAFSVKVLNAIDTTMLQLNTLELMSASHPVSSTQFVYHERNLEFKLDNILLPDSNTNEPMSHGFVRYKIKPKTTLILNDSIKSFAAIYFDFNAPVITNTAITTVVLPAAIPNQATHPGMQVVLYPNPAAEYVVISAALIGKKETAEIKMVDLFGRIVFEGQQKTTNQKLKTTLDISGLPNGFYMVEVNGFKAKFVKQ